MSIDFGPLSTRTNSSYHGGSHYHSVLNTSLFYHSWRAEGTNALGETAAAEYTMLHPSGGIAYFHLLLDASGSTWERVKTGDKKRVYKHLLKNFEQLVEYGDTLRPHDVIYVWTFNKRTQLLCRVERKNFHAQLETIRAAYKKEFDGTNYKETRLYDAIAKVMVKIREEYKDHKQADFFLVPFTDGEDFGSETASLNGMMEEINSVGGRLHTFFITANMPPTSGLYKRLQSQQNEITLVDCEKSEPNDISRAFNTLRELIKVLLVVLHRRGGEIHMTRVADYGATEHDAAERMMFTLQSLSRETSILDGLSQMRRSIGYVPQSMPGFRSGY
ncbi:hypothetical protein M758_11G064100 [Ceratodon purpureus]|uniref:VWFA domain-containing protein n=1 Tax=Ceratodon purpureus TaxID=3225 RepID=A0A8T0GB47_CERPU|nr:hypothetical protein KC19_11G066000 [Ceratodon purpureus]KAG0600832.1 hypothetical protein M758_11G064100 [Ceratodon purpureus]